MVHIAAFSIDSDDKVHLSKKALIAYLKVDEVSTKVPSEYGNFADIFSPKLALELYKYMGINNYAIKLVDDWQSSYDPIYSLGPVELKTLEIYIENNLANSVIKSFKSSVEALIFFDKKLDRGLKLGMDYCRLNNLMMKNRYLSFLIGELLNW